MADSKKKKEADKGTTGTLSSSSSSRPKNYFSTSIKDPITNDYVITRQIGEGGFSVVRLASSKKDDRDVAIKVVKKRKMTKEALEREVFIWQLALEHSDSVVALYSIYEDRHEVFLVMEMMSGGELFDRIVELEDYTEEYASQVVCQLAKIVMDIHRANIAHRDLKPENLLLESKTSPKLKLCDFGLAAISHGERDLNTIVGSRTYMAPEVFDKEKGHGKAVDLYAIGIIMYILLCGYPPFEPENGITTLEFPSPEWDEISKEAKDLISKLLDKDPQQRPTANQIMRHPWISGAEEVRRSRSRLFGTQKTLRRLKDMNKGDLKPGMTMKDFRGRKDQPTVFNLFSPLEQQPATTNTSTPTPAPAPTPAPSTLAPATSPAPKPSSSAQSLAAPKEKEDARNKKKSPRDDKRTPRDDRKQPGAVSVEELFLAFQKELRSQREQIEFLRRDNLSLRTKLAEEQVLREELDSRLSSNVKTLQREVSELQTKLRRLSPDQ